jgi:hypothetical protein
MSDTSTIPQLPKLARLGNVVPEGYQYYQKTVTHRDGLALPNAYLKWYDLYPPDAPITPDQASEARSFLHSEVVAGKLDLQDNLGFVVLHRAGSSLLLLVTTWRNTNEMWLSSYYKPADQTATYELFVYDTDHRATYCVWELGIVWHERNAWVRFLSSERDNEAELTYLNDHFSGQV